MSNPRSALRAGLTLVYTARAQRSHYLDPAHSPSSFHAALCGHSPDWPYFAWFGTGSWAETEVAASLPLCRTCRRKASE